VEKGLVPCLEARACFWDCFWDLPAKQKVPIFLSDMTAAGQRSFDLPASFLLGGLLLRARAR
jgi:hypothetical protein